jgi:hypothetical protein
MGYSCLRWIVLYYIKIFAYFYTIRNNINSWSLALSKMTQGRPEKVDFFIQNRDLFEF